MKTITVKGVGRASAPVDTVELSFHIWAKDQKYDQALHIADRKVTALETALCVAGFPAVDFKTAAFHVNTEYERVRDETGNYQSVFLGYICSYEQVLRFNYDTVRLAKAIVAVRASKSEPKLQVSFTVQKPEKLEATLLRSATDSARAKAKILCDSAGRRLGELQSIDYDVTQLSFRSETSMNLECISQSMGAGLSKRGFSASFRPRDIELEDTAIFVWEIL